MSKDTRLFHVVRSLRSMRRFVSSHKRRLGANRLVRSDFYKPELADTFEKHLLDVGSSLSSYDQSPGERNLRRWLVSLLDQHWRVGLLIHGGGANSVTTASDILWWNLLVEANDRIMDITAVEMLDFFNEFDAALDARNAKLTTQALTMIKLKIP